MRSKLYKIKVEYGKQGQHPILLTLSSKGETPELFTGKTLKSVLYKVSRKIDSLESGV